MNKTLRLSKSGIEYLDYVWNFYSGCQHKKMGVCHVDKCWAEAIVNRFGGHYPNGFEPTFYPEAFLSPLHLKKPSIIGCAFMGDLFGDWVNPEEKIHADMPSGKASITMSLKGWIFTTIKQCPWHTFLFLTKQPRNLIKWSPFPDNCWVGVTATDNKMADIAQRYMLKVEAKIKYLSIEPFLEHIQWEFILGYNQVIIGSQTKPYKPPTREWVDEILGACGKAKIPVFLKNNLVPMFNAYNKQKFPHSPELWDMTELIKQEIPK